MTWATPWDARREHSGLAVQLPCPLVRAHQKRVAADIGQLAFNRRHKYRLGSSACYYSGIERDIAGYSGRLSTRAAIMGMRAD